AHAQSILDLAALDQLVSSSQTRSIARIIHATSRAHNKRRTMREWLDLVDDQALDDLCTGLGIVGDLGRPRRIEVAQAINRLRFACIEQQQS
ncbi:hypothetical protein GGF37_007307, partial [Kickxella alabastrina]